MKGCGCSGKLPCGCCEGVEVITPRSTVNRPGLNAIRYRVGTHAAFFESMQARLSSDQFPPLADLKTRDTNDQSIAFLDAAATMLDVLTFYQERIANEGYLRTATERRSIVELARLIGYKPRPGVASSVYLAYQLDDASEPIEIPAGARAQSIPEKDELPQSFETSEKLESRAEWNDLRPRMNQPQEITRGRLPDLKFVYFQGTDTELQPNDLLLFKFGRREEVPVPVRIRAVEPDFNASITKVELHPKALDRPQVADIRKIVEKLVLPPSLNPPSAFHLHRNVAGVFGKSSDIRPQLLTSFYPKLADTLYPALSAATVSVSNRTLQAVYAMRVEAPLFGHNAPMVMFGKDGERVVPLDPPVEPKLKADEKSDRLFLDNGYDEILATENTRESFVAIDRDGKIGTFRIEELRTRRRTAYLLSGKTTQLRLNDKWWRPNTEEEGGDDDFSTIRNTTVYAQSEQLALGEEPITGPISGNTIELAALYGGLKAGRWIIVYGERTDIPNTSGIYTSELAMISRVEQLGISGDNLHTTLHLFSDLAYTYKRATVKIYGNVVEATHGETRNEVLGSGNAAQSFQAFTLRQPPLTYVAATTPSGIESTLEVRVNDVEWSETDSLASLSPEDRSFITKTWDDAKTTVVFGNGKQGSRLPTGIENIAATYRNGIGKSGNVKPKQISLLITKPLGVKEVINPLRSSGGADKETRDQARGNAPIAVKALDRLVSTVDYADLSRTFAGIGKARAIRIASGGRQLVHVTIAGADDIPIDINSALYLNLRRALSKFGDPYLAVDLGLRELLALVIVANVRIRPEYLWEKVAANLRSALSQALGFERRELGQSVYLSEVISVMHNVPGVAFVDVDTLDSISETEITDPGQLGNKFTQLGSGSGPNKRVIARSAIPNPDYAPNAKPPQLLSVLPAQLAYLMPGVPDTLIINQIEEVQR